MITKETLLGTTFRDNGETSPLFTVYAVDFERDVVSLKADDGWEKENWRTVNQALEHVNLPSRREVSPGSNHYSIW